ncbi:MAG: YeeE/YedE family protein [Proteobacteria bacterium]|nr:YeeE/YedE family protein [Pseudomonadota bacterium]
MFAELGFDLAPKSGSVIVGGLLGLAFGALAQRSRFCLRRGLVGSNAERRSALGVWLAALAVAILGTGLSQYLGLIDLSATRFFAARVPVAAIATGGLLFGAGMVLARGCASRLTVLAGSGNLRAVVTLLVFALVAHATLKGVLAPVRTALGAYAADLGGNVSLAALPGGGLVWSIASALVLASFVLRSGARPAHLLAGGLIGAVAVAGWLATGALLKDEFDPVPVETIALTSAATDTLFWWIASSAVGPTFGVGFLSGVIGGSFLAALVAREFRVEGFGADAPAGRYLAGGALMGLGGVLAGGCTIGAGIGGVSTLSFGAMLALVSMVGGALVTNALLRGGSRIGSLTAAQVGALHTP